ncbi:MAG: tRNA lysidine(34) synthetase TilS [Candidatus Homeothermus sp.]|nr:tRNA lysidine(34) synthetase TilS [Candidatus Homeothermus sp.]
MNDFIGKVSGCIERNRLLPHASKVIVALSGGADSVALLVVLHESGYDCIAAHCDFHLRGEESERDRRYAESVASQYASQYRETHFDVNTYKKEHGVSTEMACRDLRYEWFRKLSEEYGGIPVAIAHHHDDNIETLLLNLLRGTGITGLTGMQYRNGIFIRPMLDCRRKEVEAFLSDKKIPYVTDSTNLISDVKRNKLRNIILPELRREFPDADKGLATTLHNLRDTATLFDTLVNDAASRFINGNRISIARLAGEFPQAPALLFEMLKPYGFNATHVNDMMEAVNSLTASGKQFFSSTHRATLNRGELIIGENRTHPDTKLTIDPADSISLPEWLTAEWITPDHFKPDRSGNTLYLDSSALEGSPVFTLRHRKEGDRIAPFGMKGSRLVSDIFSDAKLSVNEKNTVWLLTRDDTILWIAGMRTSRHFAVTPSTRRILALRYHPLKDTENFWGK